MVNDRVIVNPNFKSNNEFHKSLMAKGLWAKDWPNTHTEVEYLGDGKFAASIGVGHRVFFDKADGNKPKKHKFTDERPTKDYVLIQGAKCCVEVYPYYAKYFDVQHEEVRVEEERWVVQRLFKEPDEWRDVDAYNPQIAIEEYPEPAGDVVKVTVTYDTDYGELVVEYFQRDGNNLKHNVTFRNTSGSTETFRVLQRWSGISGNKVNGTTVVDKTIVKGSLIAFGNDTLKIGESASSLGQQGIEDVLEMFTGSREPGQSERILASDDGVLITTKGLGVYLKFGTVEAEPFCSSDTELSSMVRAVEDCPNNARVFIANISLGGIFFPLALSRKATEVIVCEKNPRVARLLTPFIESWFGRRYPNINLTILQGNPADEIAKHGTFDWIFVDNEPWDEEPPSHYTPYLNKGGVYTEWWDIVESDRVLHREPVEISTAVNGLKADFIYRCWYLANGETLEIDPDTYSSDDPTEDGHITWKTEYTRDNSGITVIFGSYGGCAVWYNDYHGYVQWDISALAGMTLDGNPFFKYDGFSVGATDGEINPITEEDPVSATDANLYAYIVSGTAYVDPFTLVGGVNQSQDLGAGAKAHLQTAATAEQSWFAIGFASPADEGSTIVRTSSFYSEEKTDAPTPKPTLEVEYSLGVDLPTVTTQAVDDIAATTATGNGNITDTGGENCDYRGFVWDTSSHEDPGNVAPASSDYGSNWTEGDSFGTGTYEHTVHTFRPNTKYYVRACAHNSEGWSYGEEVNFTTKTSPLPTSYRT